MMNYLIKFIILFYILVFGIFSNDIPVYRVVIDPGHGGAPKNVYDDKWDPITKQYLDYYNIGMRYKNYYEYKIVLQIARKVYRYLKFTETEEGWEKFQWLLKQFSEQTNFKRIIIKTYLTRTNNWEDRGIPASSRIVNDPYRLYDYPKNKKIYPGRISYINSLKPHLVISIHLNPGGPGHPGGMAAVLAPGYKTFDLLRKVTLGKEKPDVFNTLPWAPFWLVNEPGWSKFEMAMADAWVYFHGFRWHKDTKKPWLDKDRGIRYNMVSWRYRDKPDWVIRAIKQRKYHIPGPYTLEYDKFIPEGPFWDRERSELEYWRREKPLPEYNIFFGGDNHYASDELLRFLQYGLRIQKPELDKQKKISEIIDPFVSTYGLPTLVNAICAYLEIAHLDVKRDRELVLNYQYEIARSLAVGIYSLFAGLELKKDYNGPFKPRGQIVDFNKYINHKEGNYFEKVVE
ncbi:MAG: N-acetylmuramoyl-L-alanine amidase [Leptospiraceae bacterium]|nr:MAG: N-acetylmuramoyl-L-alanine amidase [Leptospiraceae bacterium]